MDSQFTQPGKDKKKKPSFFGKLAKAWSLKASGNDHSRSLAKGQQGDGTHHADGCQLVPASMLPATCGGPHLAGLPKPASSSSASAYAHWANGNEGRSMRMLEYLRSHMHDAWSDHQDCMHPTLPVSWSPQILSTALMPCLHHMPCMGTWQGKGLAKHLLTLSLLRIVHQ
jgi:hypothetical protein